MRYFCRYFVVVLLAILSFESAALIYHGAGHPVERLSPKSQDQISFLDDLCQFCAALDQSRASEVHPIRTGFQNDLFRFQIQISVFDAHHGTLEPLSARGPPV